MRRISITVIGWTVVGCAPNPPVPIDWGIFLRGWTAGMMTAWMLWRIVNEILTRIDKAEQKMADDRAKFYGEKGKT